MHHPPSLASPARARPTPAAVGRSAAFAVLFCLAVFAGRSTVMDGTSLSLVWPAAGVAVLWFAAQRQAGTRWLDYVLLALPSFAINLVTGASAALAGCFVLANIAQVAVFGALFARWCPQQWGAGGSQPLTGVAQLARLLAVAVLATAAGAVIGPSAVGLLTGYWSWLTALVWMTRNSVSVLLIAAVGFRLGCLISEHRRQRAQAPLLPSSSSSPSSSWQDFSGQLPFLRVRGWRLVELIAAVVCSGGAYVLIFTVFDDLPVAFPLIAISVWVALRFDTTIVVAHDLAVGVLAVLFTLHGEGPFAHIGDDSTRALVVQLFVGLIAVVALALALGRDERDVLLARVRHEAAEARQHRLLAEQQHAYAEEQRALAELSMAEAEARDELSQAVLESAEVGIVIATADGRLAALNRTALTWHGLAADADLDPAQHAGVYALYGGDGRTPLAAADVPLARVLREGSVQEAEIVIAPAQLPARTVLCSGRTMQRSDGTSLGAVVVMSDVSATRAREAALQMLNEELSGAHQAMAAIHDELAQRSSELAEQGAQLAERSVELERSNAELAQFASVASHDLNSPLTVIAGYLEILDEMYGDALDEQGRQFIATALSATGRMRDLIQALLAYSGAGAGAAQCRRERTDLRVVFEQAVLDLRAGISEAGAQVSASSLPVLYGDDVLLRQLLQNLIANAVKYRSPQRACRIGVSASLEGEGWALAVADNGIGIPAEQREAVFAMFAQVDPSARTGHGIGLATCQRIVERHGGRIWVEETPGGGTTVRFTLPQRTPAPSPAASAVRAAALAPGTASLN